MLASLIDVSHVGYPLLFAAVMAESSGFLVPGETALHGAEQPARAVPVVPLLLLAHPHRRVGHAAQRRGLRHAPGL